MTKASHIPLSARTQKSILMGGFTLIEVAVVLVIIGLLVGGVLVGRELIAAAAVRSQIVQIGKFNQATGAFKDMYGFLPGDINATAAAGAGLNARGQYAGEGDGNGIIEGVSANSAGSNNGIYEAGGETTLFWADLAATNLVSGNFSSGNTISPTNTHLYSPYNNYFPTSSLGNGSYVYVWSNNSINYFGLSGISLNSLFNVSMGGVPSLTVSQAYQIDTKMDDGLPQSGKVLAAYVASGGLGWEINSSQSLISSGFPIPYTSAAMPASTSSCVDNGNVPFGAVHYSLTYSGGIYNCGLSFQFQ